MNKKERELRIRQIDEILAITWDFFQRCEVAHGKRFLRSDMDKFLDERLEILARNKEERK